MFVEKIRKVKEMYEKALTLSCSVINILGR